MRILVLSTLSALALTACGLDSAGVGAAVGDDAGPVGVDAGPPTADAGGRIEGGAPDDVSPGADSASDACASEAGACVAAIPSGWTLALLGAGGATCPSGFGPRAAITDPIAGSGACACACTVSGTPTCTSGNIATFYSNDASCGSQGLTLNASGGACTAIGGGIGGANLSSHFAATAPPAQVACTATVAKDASKVSSKPVVLCESTSACAEEVCSAPPPAGFAACIHAPGDVPCPGAPWTTRTVTGDAATLSCASCSGCTATASCTSPTVHFFGDGQCTQSVVSLPADGSCVATGGGGRVAAFKYSATVANETCTATGSSTATLAMSGTRTVCCR